MQVLCKKICSSQVLDDALKNPQQAKFLIKEKIEEFRGFGGVC